MGSDAFSARNCRDSRAVPPLHAGISEGRGWKSPDIPLQYFSGIDQVGYKLPIDERILEDTDTLMVFGLDHLVSEQEASSGEIQAVREWLKREGTCLLLGPHHDVGFTEDLEQRQLEYTHHGDALVLRQQRFGQYTRSDDESAWGAGNESIRTSPGPRQRHKTNCATDHQQRPG